MSTPQDPGQPPTQQYGGQPGYPQQGGTALRRRRVSPNPWPWVLAGVAIIVAGVIAALLITGGGDESSKTTNTTTITRTAPKVPTTTTTLTTTQTQSADRHDDADAAADHDDDRSERRVRSSLGVPQTWRPRGTTPLHATPARRAAIPPGGAPCHPLSPRGYTRRGPC